MKSFIEKWEALLEFGGTKKDISLLVLGGIGSDIAVDAADIALVNEDVRELPHLLALSKNDEDHQAESDFFHDTELCGHCTGHHRYSESGGRSTGAQLRLSTGYH